MNPTRRAGVKPPPAVPGARGRVLVNGRELRVPTARCAVICIDGCSATDLLLAAQARATPFLAALARHGTVLRARAALPTLTNPNNVSIVTGVAPAVHGIAGNYCWDAARGCARMMVEPAQRRADTVLAALEHAGVGVALVTAKDKLRRLLGDELRGVCVSTERAGEPTADPRLEGRTLAQWAGFEPPEVYSAALSLRVFDVALRLLDAGFAELLYLSTSDVVQHHHAPGTPDQLAFYRALDGALAALHARGVAFALTADHGMSAKTDAAGRARVIHLQTLLDARWGAGSTRVCLPITDPYLAHHGALGSCATVARIEPGRLPPADELARALAALPGVDGAWPRDEAAWRFELPADRIDDVFLLAEHDTVFGTHAHEHDLSVLQHPLRSHGGRAEQVVPMLFNRRLVGPEPADPRNFDAFDLLLNREWHAMADAPPLTG